MANKRRMSESQARIRLFFILIAVAVVVVVIVVLIARMRGGSISQSTVNFERKDLGVVIIRDEKTKLSKAYGKIIYMVDEGQAVEAGAKIAEVYHGYYNKNVEQDLLNLQRQIKQYQKHTILNDVVNTSLNDVEQRIAQKTQNIVDRIRSGGPGDLLILQRELESLMTERQTLLKSITQPDVQLNDYYEAEQSYIEALSASKAEVTASEDGVVSFYFDGYEPLLNTDTIDALTPADLQAVFKQKPPTSVLSKTERPLFRLVNQDVWYLAVATDKRDNFYMVNGENYSLKFEGFYDKTYTGKVVYTKRTEDNGSVYILQINDDVSDFLSLRTVKVDISAEFTGLSVPASSIARNSKNEAGVYVEIGDESTFVPVEMLAIENGRAVFRSKDISLSEGMRYENRIAGSGNVGQ